MDGAKEGVKFFIIPDLTFVRPGGRFAANQNYIQSNNTNTAILMTYSYRHIWLISYPILAGLLIQQLIGLTDTAFLGRVGEIELGASAIAGVFYIMIFMLGQGFSVGAQIIIARRNGEQNYQRIGPIVYQGIAFLLLTTIVIAALMFRFSPAVLSAIISSPAVCQAALDYLQPRIFGFFFAIAIKSFSLI